MNNNEEIFIVGHHHELALLGPDPHEGDVIAGVHLFEHAGGLGHEAAQDAAVLTAGARIQRGLDAGSLLIYNYEKLGKSMFVTYTLLTTTVPMTPLCPTNLFRVSSTSAAIFSVYLINAPSYHACQLGHQNIRQTESLNESFSALTH